MVKPVIEILRTYIKSLALENIYLSKSLEERKERVQVSKTMKRLFRLIYYVMKIRGYKTVGEFGLVGREDNGRECNENVQMKDKIRNTRNTHNFCSNN